MRPVRPIWMDVQNGKVYPVFDVKKGPARTAFTYPTQDPKAYKQDGIVRNEWTVDHDGVLVATAGHLHPGGLHTDLWVERAGHRPSDERAARRTKAAKRRCRRGQPSVRGDTAHLFRSDAEYFEPAGAVSWDVAMTATRPDWKVKLRKGDVLRRPRPTTPSAAPGTSRWGS